MERDMQFKTIKVNELKPSEYNPRKDLQPTDPEYKKIKRSIEEFGYVEPIIINYDNTIIGGHQRLKILKDLGYKEIDVIQINISKTKEKALNIALNKITGEWDTHKLQDLLLEINNDIDLTITGFDADELDDLFYVEAEAIEDDYEVVEPEEPKAKLGDIYQLGRHRLMCGDSTNRADVEKLLNDAEMDMALTDPPYNVDYEGTDGMKIENDNMGNEEFIKFLTAAFENLEHSLKPGGAFYIWHANMKQMEFETAMRAAGLNKRQQLVWVKNAITLGRQDYQWKHEPCFYGWKDGATHFFINDRSKPTVIEEEEIDLNKLKKEELKEILERIVEENKNTNTIIYENKPTKNGVHPTMKPIKLMAKQINNSSKEGQNVIDLFGGSGSTLIACEQLKRNCYIMEYDPKYVDVIIDRYEQFTGDHAVKIQSGKEE